MNSTKPRRWLFEWVVFPTLPRRAFSQATPGTAQFLPWFEAIAIRKNRCVLTEEPHFLLQPNQPLAWLLALPALKLPPHLVCEAESLPMGSTEATLALHRLALN